MHYISRNLTKTMFLHSGTPLASPSGVPGVPLPPGQALYMDSEQSLEPVVSIFYEHTGGCETVSEPLVEHQKPRFSTF